MKIGAGEKLERHQFAVRLIVHSICLHRRSQPTPCTLFCEVAKEKRWRILSRTK